ncbi:hypothetical protein CUTA107171_19870 [Cupriavidus taiwanensis]
MEIPSASHSSGAANASDASKAKGWNGRHSRHAARLAPYCSGSTSAGARVLRFCRMAPSVMLASEASAHSTPAGDSLASNRLSATTMASPAKASARPPRRAALARRSVSSSVSIGCAPSTVASTPGVMPWSRARK